MRRSIVYTFYLLVTLIPLTFTSVNSELFEFPKFILLIAATLTFLIAWALYIYQTHDYAIFPAKHNKWITYSMLAVLVTQTVATIFSIHPYTSFWGYYSRFHGGLLSTLCYTIIYFAAIKFLDKKSTQKILKISVSTAIFISVIAILEHYNISLTCLLMTGINHLQHGSDPVIMSTGCWGANTNPLGRSFATLGQPNWLAAYLIPNMFFVFYFAQIKKNKNVLSSLYSIFLFSILLLALLYTKSRSGFLAFTLAYPTYWLLECRQLSFAKIVKSFTLYSIFLFFVLALFGTPYTPTIKTLLDSKQNLEKASISTGGTALETGGTESGDIRKIVWTGALKLIEKHPLLGTGPETFAYTYYWERPAAHNMTSEWDFLYNKAHNEYLNTAAGAGLIGLLAYLAWHGAIFLAGWTTIPKSKKITQETDDEQRATYPVLTASVIAFSITNFFGFSVIPVYLLMILVAAFATTIQQEEITPRPATGNQYIALALISVIGFIWPFNLFYADYLYAQGKGYLDLGRPTTAIPLLENAITYRPTEDLYLSTLSESYALLATATHNADDVQKALKLVSQTQAHNPWHLNYFKSRAKVYLTLATLDPKYNAPAALELENAHTLAPTDPKLTYNLGLVYTRLDQNDKAIALLKETISLKMNYQDPYYALTLIYEQTNQADKLPNLLTEAKANLATYSAQLKDKIEKYTK